MINKKPSPQLSGRDMATQKNVSVSAVNKFTQRTASGGSETGERRLWENPGLMRSSNFVLIVLEHYTISEKGAIIGR